jgi:hypothetical protein
MRCTGKGPQGMVEIDRPIIPIGFVVRALKRYTTGYAGIVAAASLVPHLQPG